jgi:hypothetical protein
MLSNGFVYMGKFNGVDLLFRKNLISYFRGYLSVQMFGKLVNKQLKYSKNDHDNIDAKLLGALLRASHLPAIRSKTMLAKHRRYLKAYLVRSKRD